MPEYYVGLMSGTSLDGVDAALADCSTPALRLVSSHHASFTPALRAELLALQFSGTDELHRAALAANALAAAYAQSVKDVLAVAGIAPAAVAAIGCHGQTVRHRPDAGYTTQLANPALLAELTGITIVADFRGRDIAASGQGAPLVPAFHCAVFRAAATHRVIVNIGGIANLTDLPPAGDVRGFDCGPGNILMDAWIERIQGLAFDRDGAWAASGKVLPALLGRLLAEPYFDRMPPKSTGRDLFNLAWLRSHLAGSEMSADVQATLLELTAFSIARAIGQFCPDAREVYLCGGGARNRRLAEGIANKLAKLPVAPTDKLGIAAEWVEALAFAWLAQQTLKGEPANLPAVTGARGRRILGAIYRA